MSYHHQGLPNLTTLVSNDSGQMIEFDRGRILVDRIQRSDPNFIMDSTSFKWIRPHYIMDSTSVEFGCKSCCKKIFFHHTRFNLLILDSTSLYWIQPPYTGFDLLILDSNSLHWIRPPYSYTGFDLPIMYSTSLYWI